jgi:uncharacterized surface protein with fasciclin (FAS1) repeats
MRRVRALVRSLFVAVAFTVCALPAAAQDIVDVIAKDPELSTFLNALRAAGLETAMKTQGPITVLVPTNAAFARLDPAVMERLLQPPGKSTLTDIVKFHVLPADYPQSRLINAYVTTFKVTTAQGNSLNLDVTRLKTNGVIAVEGVPIPRPEIKASNGSVYVIDAVLFPPSLRSLAAKPAVPAKQ